MKPQALSNIERNMKEKLRYLASRIPSMQVQEVKGVSCVDTTLPSDTFNTAFGGQIDDEVAQAVFSFYETKKQPMAWWIGPSSHPEVTEVPMKRAGFTLDEVDVGMVCELSELAETYRPPPRLVIHQCVTPADFAEVLSSVFTPPDEQVKLFYKQAAALQNAEDMVFFVGYEENLPVSTACLFVTDVAGIYDIATRPEKRKQGYGSALFQHALVEAKKRGLKQAVLQASPDGLNIYKRFGCEEVCTFHVWSNRKKPTETA